MSKWRYSQGILTAIRRGDPPPIPDGFEPTDDPYVALLTIPTCVFRCKKTVKRPCCGDITLSFCSHFVENTNRKKCHDCTVPNKTSG